MGIDIGETVQVLDHGYVRLVDFMGTDESIIEAARMSTGKGFVSWAPYRTCRHCGLITATMEGQVELGKACEAVDHDWESSPRGDLGLLDTLWRKKHATPFEMVELAFEVQAPLFVFREWHRHRTQSYNEFSARYAQMKDLHYIPDKNRFRKQDAHNKQGSGEEQMGIQAVMGMQQELRMDQHIIYQHYEGLLDEGLAKEVARINTPVSRYSKMRAKANLRNWLQFLNLRMRPDAQWEIRQYAEAIGNMIKELFPNTWGLFLEYDLYGAHFSRSELQVLRSWIEGLQADLKMTADDAPIDDRLSGRKLKEFLMKVRDGGEKILT